MEGIGVFIIVGDSVELEVIDNVTLGEREGVPGKVGGAVIVGVADSGIAVKHVVGGDDV